MRNMLPAGWAWSTLGGVGRYLNGRGFKKSEWGQAGRPIIRIQNLTKSSNHINYFDGHADPRHVVHPGDLLVSWAATLGIFVWRGQEAVLNQHIFKVESLIHQTFHRWLLEYVLGDLHAQAHGSGMIHITKSKFEATRIPIPPLAEQKRIVDVIEEHFSRLDSAETTLRATSRKLDAWRTSFLTDACRGAWPKAQLSDVITSLRNGVFVSRPSAQPPGYPIYRISAVRPLALRTDDIRFADPVPKKADAYKVKSGDILVTRYSGNPSYVGAAAVVPPGGAGILHPDKLIRVVADRDKALPEWIAAYLSVGEGRRGIEQRLKTTAGQVGISGSQLKTVQVAVPPLSHQQDVAAKIGILQEAQDRVRQQLDGIAVHVQALRRSVLVAAFSGRLVPQDPDDEPASVLLERIASSRPAKPERRRTRT